MWSDECLSPQVLLLGQPSKLYHHERTENIQLCKGLAVQRFHFLETFRRMLKNEGRQRGPNITLVSVG